MLDRLHKNLFRNAHDCTRSEHQDSSGNFMKLEGNPDYSKSDSFKRLSVLAQILRLL